IDASFILTTHIPSLREELRHRLFFYLHALPTGGIEASFIFLPTYHSYGMDYRIINFFYPHIISMV
ncbi:MAG: hypothetical protein ABI760_14655, partial [Ferruginibacter sp.]